MIPHAYVLLGDLISSRDQIHRPQLAQRIEQALGRLAIVYQDQWIASLETSRGLDELSGVLCRPDRAFDIAIALNRELWPVTFRFALADDLIDVGNTQTRASQMDGPAFHTAADALDRARKHRLPFAIGLANTDPATAAVVEQAARLHQVIMSDWTAATARAVQLYRPIDANRSTQRKVATELGQTQQAVADAHRRAHLHELFDTEEAIRQYFSAYSPSTHRGTMQ